MSADRRAGALSPNDLAPARLLVLRLGGAGLGRYETSGDASGTLAVALTSARAERWISSSHWRIWP